MKTELYALDREGSPLPGALVDRLPVWRRERYDRLKNENARQESLGAGLLFSFVMRMSGVDPDGPVTVLPAGKPVFTGRGDVYFSLSHSGRYILCAVSGRPVGADVQAVRPVKLSIARRFHPDEQRWLSSLPEPERERGLYRIWTRKEAWVKAVSAERMLTLAETDVVSGIPGLCFADYEPEGGYLAALCGEDPALPGKITILTTEQIIS